MVNEACKLGLVNNSLDDYGGNNGSSLINGLLYYYISPILNMDKDEKVIKEMVDTLSENGIEESQPPITEIVNFIKKVSPRCSDYLLKCLWHSSVVNCSDVSFNFKIINSFDLWHSSHQDCMENQMSKLLILCSKMKIL